MTSAPPTFLAPSLGAFLAPKTLLFFAAGPVDAFFTAVADRTAVGAGDELSLSLSDRGDFERGPLAPAFRNGEPVRLTTGGVPVREGGLLGRLIEGLSHEEKKSSSVSPGVLEPFVDASAATSVITTSPGNLPSTHDSQFSVITGEGDKTGIELTVAHPQRHVS